MVDKWAYFFREAKNLDVVPPALSKGPFLEALDVARTASFSPAEWEAYDRAKMAEQDARGALAVAHEEGVEEGELKGKRDALLRLLDRAHGGPPRPHSGMLAHDDPRPVARQGARSEDRLRCLLLMRLNLAMQPISALVAPASLGIQ